MKTEFESLVHSVKILGGACTMLAGHEGATIRVHYTEVLNKVEQLVYKAETTAAEPATPSGLPRIHEQGPELVLHDMELWQVRPNGVLYDGIANRAGVSMSDTFAVSLEKIMITKECKDLTDQIFNLGNRLLDRHVVRGRLIDIWKTIICTENEKPNLEVYKTDFVGFIEKVQVAVGETHRRTIDGVEIFTQQ